MREQSRHLPWYQRAAASAPGLPFLGGERDSMAPPGEVRGGVGYQEEEEEASEGPGEAEEGRLPGLARGQGWSPGYLEHRPDGHDVEEADADQGADQGGEAAPHLGQERWSPRGHQGHLGGGDLPYVDWSRQAEGCRTEPCHPTTWGHG